MDADINVKRKGNPHSGKAFEGEIRASLKYLESQLKTRHPPIVMYWQRIYDLKDWIKANAKVQVPHQPSDFMMIVNGEAYFLECKSTRNATSYPFAYVKNSQIESLLKLKCSGAHAFLLVCNRSVPRNFYCSALDIEKFIYLKEKAIDEHRQSIKWVDIRSSAISLPRIKGGMWDLTPLLKGKIK